MCSVGTDLQSGDSVSAPCEAFAHPVESIALTMKGLDEAASQMQLAITEVLSVTMFCAEVKRSLSSMIGAELNEPRRAAEPILDQLYQGSHHNLAAMRRAGRQTLAAIKGVEQAASALYQLAVQLEAQHLRAAASAPGNNELAPSCTARPGCGCMAR